MATRMLFDFEPSRQNALEKEGLLVAGFMRVVYSIPRHREYMRTGSPSEPILAEAAAQVMDEAKEAAVLELIQRFLAHGMIDKGRRGELIARFLLIRAYDRAIKHGKGIKAESSRDLTHGRFSLPIRLLDFLEELLQPEHFEKIKKSTPQNVKGGVTSEEAFKDARIYFSHFAKAEGSSVLKDEFAYSAMCSGFAWQCANQQQSIDILIPILLWDVKLSRYVMSALALQIKNRIRGMHVFIDLEKNSKFFSTPPEDAIVPDRTRPYIALTMQLGRVGDGEVLTTDSPVRQSTNPSQYPRYAFYANGCSSTVYKVIEKDEDHVYAKMLASRDILSEHPRQNKDFLNAVEDMRPYWKPESFTWLERFADERPNDNAGVPGLADHDGVYLEEEVAGAVDALM